MIARDCRSRQGLRVHKVETLDRRDRAKRRGIPATAPARTLIDYASTAGADEVDGGTFTARVRRSSATIGGTSSTKMPATRSSG